MIPNSSLTEAQDPKMKQPGVYNTKAHTSYLKSVIWQAKKSVPFRALSLLDKKEDRIFFLYIGGVRKKTLSPPAFPC